MFTQKRKKGQVWIETTIYTVIGLVIIAILITTATPQIEKIKDDGVLDKTMGGLLILNNKISEIEQAGGNSREVQFTIAKGKLTIDAEENIIQYVLEDTRLELTEPNVTIKEGDIYILTQERGSRFDVYLTLNYSGSLNMTFDGEKKTDVLQASGTPYRIVMENVGDNGPLEDTHINFELW